LARDTEDRPRPVVFLLLAGEDREYNASKYLQGEIGMNKIVLILALICFITPLPAQAEQEVAPPRLIAHPSSEETGQRYVKITLQVELAKQPLRGLVIAVTDSPEKPQYWGEFQEEVHLRQEGIWYIHYIIADEGRGYMEGFFGPYIIRYGLPPGYQPPEQPAAPPVRLTWFTRLQQFVQRLFLAFASMMGLGGSYD
jgi:hypothetical protein